MPDFSIIDAHFHIWDPGRLPMSWQKGNATLSRPFLPEDYRQATVGLDIEAMVFVECFVDRGFLLDEVRFVEEYRVEEPRIKSIVAQAPLEKGTAIRPYLEQLKQNYPRVTGIRRLIESEDNPEFCLQPDFIEALGLLNEFNYSFDITVQYTQMQTVLELIQKIGDVTLILDHCGKPGIRDGHIEPWRTYLKEMAQNPNLYCKLSGLPSEADHTAWNEEELKPYIDAVVDAFGFDRLIYAGDWPVCTQATTLPHWVALLERHFSGVPEEDLRRFYRDNAISVYRIVD